MVLVLVGWIGWGRGDLSSFVLGDWGAGIVTLRTSLVEHLVANQATATVLVGGIGVQRA